METETITLELPFGLREYLENKAETFEVPLDKLLTLDILSGRLEYISSIMDDLKAAYNLNKDEKEKNAINNMRLQYIEEFETLLGYYKQARK